MDDVRQTRRAKFEAEISAMLRDGRVDGIVRLLERKYGRRGEIIEDAVITSIVKLLSIADTRDIKNTTAFVTTMAERSARRAFEREALYGDEPIEDEDHAALSAEIDVFEAKRTVTLLKKTMSDWPETMRVVTSIVLDTIAEDIDVSSEDVARDASDILGREISADEARTWKSRGLKRLRETLKPE